MTREGVLDPFAEPRAPKVDRLRGDVAQFDQIVAVAVLTLQGEFGDVDRPRLERERSDLEKCLVQGGPLVSIRTRISPPYSSRSAGPTHRLWRRRDAPSFRVRLPGRRDRSIDREVMPPGPAPETARNLFPPVPRAAELGGGRRPGKPRLPQLEKMNSECVGSQWENTSSRTSRQSSGMR